MKIFKPLPSLEGLSVVELNELLTERRELCAKLGKNDPELAPPDSFSAQDILDELTAGVEQIKTLEGELSTRAEAEAAFEAEVATRLEAAGVKLEADASGDDADAAAADGDDAAGDDAAGDDAADDASGDLAADTTDDAAADAAADDTTEVVAAAVRQIRRPLPRPAMRNEPVVVDDADKRTALVAAVDYAAGEGVRAGDDLDRMGFAKAAIASAAKITPAPGQAVQVVVASARWEAPIERQLSSRDPNGNADKLKAVVGEKAVLEFAAAGNVLCAPLTPIYDLPQISTEQRPVRDSLPPFQADRGGITWGTPPSIADVTTAIGIITPEDEEEGGTFATKSCQLLECDEFNSQEVSSIFHCLQWGNLGARAWPERVAQFTDVVMAAWARLAEENLLNQIAAGSTQVTAAQATYGYGALSSLTSEILVAAAGYRSRFRMAPDSRFVAMLPSWVRDLLLSDLINSQFDRFAIDGYAGVDAFLRSKNVEPVWYLDEENGGNQIFAAQTAGVLLHFPTAVKWFLFPIGTWIFLDTGTLELGIIRDSVLNAENEFQVFGESWEAAAQVGFQSLEITSQLCPSGATGGPATLITCA